MKKRILSAMLCLCMVISVFPTTSLAEDSPAAEIGGTTYATLSEAINMAEDSAEVKLLKDVTESVAVSGKTLTLNLSGKTLTNEVGKDTITVAADANLTVTGTGTVDNVSHAKAALLNNGIVTISDGTFTRSQETGIDAHTSGGNSYYTVYNHGTMTVTGGTVENKGHYSSTLANKGTAAKTAVLKITDGTFTGGVNTIKNDDYGDLEIVGGMFSNSADEGVQAAALMNWQTAKVTGGTFTSTAKAIINGSYRNDVDKGELTISGGTVTAPYLFDVGGDKYPDWGDIVVTGGRFTGEIGLPDKGATQASLTISGGTYTVDPTAYVNNSVSAVANAEGVYTVAPWSAANAVAQVGENYYGTLAEAVTAAESGATVKLLKNTDINDRIVIQKEMTLDLAGKKISYSGTAYPIYVYGSTANLTINDTVGNGEIYTDYYWTIYIEKNATLTVNGGTIKSNPAIDSCAISGNGSPDLGGTTININGGNIVGSPAKLSDTAAGVGIYHPQAGNLNIAGGTISGASAIEVKSGNANIAITGNPTIEAKYAEPSHAANNSGTSSCGYAVALIENAAYTGNANVNIAGGTFVGPVEKLTDSTNTQYTYTMNVTGGTYTVDPSAYVDASKYEVTASADGKTYTVAPWSTSNAAAQIGENYYGTLAEAITAAQTGETVTLLKNVEINREINVEKTITLNLNGKSITRAENQKAAFQILGEYTLTIDGTTAGSAVNGTIMLGNSSHRTGEGLVINGGTYTATVDDDCVVQTNGLCADTSITATGATFNSTDDTFYLAGSGTYTLTDCTVNGYTGIYMKSGILSTTGTTITATGAYAEPKPNGNGAISTGDGIILDSKAGYIGNMQLTLGAGTVINSTNGYAIHEALTDVNESSTVSMVVTAGSYAGGKGAIHASDAFDAAVANKTATAAISGGIFSADKADVSKYVVYGYEATDNDDTATKTAYPTKVAEKVEITEAAPSVTIPEDAQLGDLDENQKNELTEAVSKAETTVKEDAAEDAKTITAAAEAAAEEVKADTTITAESGAEALKNALEVEEVAAEDVAIVVQNYLDIAVKGANTTTDEQGKTVITALALDITPMYQVVATTAAANEEIVIGENATELGAAKELNLGTKTNVVISIALPDLFTIEDINEVVIKHEKHSGGVEYITPTSYDAETKVLTFAVENGFSPFDIEKIVENYGVTVNGIAVNNVNAANVLGNHTVSYDDETGVLTLNGASLTSIAAEQDITLNLTGANSVNGIASATNAAIDMAEGAKATVTGTGSLTVTGIAGAFNTAPTYSSYVPAVYTGETTAGAAFTTTPNYQSKYVRIQPKTAVSGISLNKTALTLTENSKETLTATITPENADNQAVSWSSSNTAVATVDANGTVTAGKKAGGQSAVITVTTADGSKTASCTVTAAHNYVAVITAPSCVAQGYTTHTCSVCGNAYVDSYVAAKGHTVVYIPGKDATCNETGLTQGAYCSDCGTVFQIQEIINKTAHTIVYDPAVAATCTKDGLTYGSHCAVCGKIIQAQSTVPAKGHNFVNYIYNHDATETEDGTETAVCANGCGATDTRTAVGTAIGESADKIFTDVDAGQYYTDPITWAYHSGVTKGITATTFAPFELCTRAQVVTFLWRAAGCPAATIQSVPFTDVEKSAYYYDAVLWGVESGVVKGITETSFQPNAQVTRGQFVTFLYRTDGSPEVTGTTPFLDVPNGKYYTNAVRWAVQKGVTAGIDSLHFAPTNACKRAEVVTFLYRYYK